MQKVHWFSCLSASRLIKNKFTLKTADDPPAMRAALTETLLLFVKESVERIRVLNLH